MNEHRNNLKISFLGNSGILNLVVAQAKADNSANLLISP